MIESRIVFSMEAAPRFIGNKASDVPIDELELYLEKTYASGNLYLS